MEKATGTKRPRPWLAFLLNLLLPPTGYAYLGRLQLCGLTFVGILVVIASGEFGTYLAPPGIYALGGRPTLMFILYVPLLLALAVHCWILAKRTDGVRRGRSALYCLGAIISLFAAQFLAKSVIPLRYWTVPSESMEPTILKGDVVASGSSVLACKVGGLKLGDVVAHRFRGTWRFKRLIAGPGSTIEIRDGVPWVDGKPALQQARPSKPTPIGEIARETLPNGVAFDVLNMMEDGPADNRPSQKVPANTWFVMGDNRDNTEDSRFHGPVPQNDICSLATKIIWSTDKTHIGRRP